LGFRGIVHDEHYERGGILPIWYMADNLFILLKAILKAIRYVSKATSSLISSYRVRFGICVCLRVGITQ